MKIKSAIVLIGLALLLTAFTVSCSHKDHSFGKWETVSAASCTEDGLEKRVCECGESEERVISKTGHSMGEWSIYTPSTSISKSEERMVCDRCGYYEAREGEYLAYATSKKTYTIQNKYSSRSNNYSSAYGMAIYRPQGGCYNGDNYYQAFISRNEELAVVAKLNVKTGETIYSKAIDMEHANDMTYNSKTNEVMVAYKYIVYVFDADTLEYKGERRLPFYSPGFSYNAHNDTYVSFHGGDAYCLYIYDADFNLIKKSPEIEFYSGHVSQGICSDDKYIYNLFCVKNDGWGTGYKTYVRIRDYDFKLVNIIEVKISGNYEPENISVINGVFYIGAATPEPSQSLYEYN